MMGKHHRIFSFELLIAILLIVAFFLPWLDWKMVKVDGWDIPELQKKLTQVGNFFKFFSKNKDWVYSTHIVYLIPFFSIIVICLWLAVRPKLARTLLFITSIFSLIVSVNLFYKLPKVGNGVYLLCGTSAVAVIYLLYVFRQKKKTKTRLMSQPPEIESEET